MGGLGGGGGGGGMVATLLASTGVETTWRALHFVCSHGDRTETLKLKQAQSCARVRSNGNRERA